MPNKSNTGRTPRQIRGGSNARKNQKRQRRKASVGSTAAAPRIIGSSLFAVTLKPKPGVEVLEKMDGKKKRSYHDDTDDYYQMYSDLLQCFQNALPLVKGEQSSFDPLASGLEIGMALQYVQNAFRENILPEGFDFNVERNDDGYYFVIYTECRFAGYWEAFEIKPIIYYLRKYNPKLHDLFIVFIRTFMNRAGIMSWYGGGMGYAEYALEEEIADWDNIHGFDPDDESDDAKENFEAFQKASATWNDYQHGEAKHYEELIKNATGSTPESLLKSLEKFNGRNPVVKWMKQVCRFLKLPGRMDDFIYSEYEEENETGLRFDQQVAVIWDWDDAYTAQQEESLEAEANGIGICQPMINMGIMPYSKKIDFEDLKARCNWPMELTKIFESQRDLINDVIKKKK